MPVPSQEARDSNRWYVLQTKPRQEMRAELNLRCRGIETLAPKILQPRRSQRGETLFQASPMFPNYVFARFELESMFAKIRLTRGVRKVVGLGECATPVQESVIHFVQSRLGDDGIVRLPGPQPGDPVEIIEGPLRSFVGLFERSLPARDRVVILLSTIGCQARVQVAKAAIRKVGHSAA